MKKTLAIVLTLVMVLGMTAGVMAAPASVKTAEVVLDAPTGTVYVGDPVTLTATTLKQGSGYTDGWTVALKVGTEKVDINGVSYYISTANFDTSVAGTFDVTYSITMTSGSSDTTFVGSKTITITVVPRIRTIDRFDLVDWYFRNQGNTNCNDPDQDNKYQLVVTKLKVAYSDGTSEVVDLTGNELVVGGFSVGAADGTERKFDLTYDGTTKQLSITAPWEPVINCCSPMETCDNCCCPMETCD